MNKIKVFSLNSKFKKEEEKLKKTVREALRKLKKDGLYVEIYLVSNLMMKKIYQLSAHKNKVTNVLSFPLKSFPRPDTSLKVLGEIYLAPDFIKAKKQDIKELVIHGLLHLLGYTHHHRSDRIKMEKWLNYLRR